jgi:hypothetical protein
MELYKYCRAEHMRQMLGSETLRIGTVFDWRRINRYGQMVMDTDDGRIHLPKSNLIIYDYRFLSSFDIKADVKEEVSGRSFKTTEISTKDAYAFSAASSYSVEDHRKWLAAEGYDACYKIISARLCFRAISQVLMNAEFALWEEILYYDDSLGNLVYEKAFHPALLKRKEEYAEQREIRAIWHARQLPIEPTIVTVPRIHVYCEEHRVLR